MTAINVPVTDLHPTCVPGNYRRSGSRFGNGGSFVDGATGATSAIGAGGEMRGRFGRPYSTPNAATGTVAAAASAVARRSSHPSRPTSSLPRDNGAVRSPGLSPVLAPVEEASSFPPAATGKDMETNVAHDRGAAAAAGVKGGNGGHVSPPADAAHAESTWLLVPTPPSETGDPVEEFPSAAADEGVDGKGNRKASPLVAAAAAAASGAVEERDGLGGDGEDKRDVGKEEMNGDGHRDLQVQAESHNPRGEVHGFAGRVQNASGSSTRSSGGNEDRGWPVQGDG